MKRITITALCLCFLCCVAADEPTFPKLPDSPATLLEVLKRSGERYTIRQPWLDYVKESDLPSLVGLLDSKEPCAFVDLSISSIYYPGQSTVGHEAAYLLEGFWKRYYPTGLTSQEYKPNVAEIKRWYQMWSNFKKLAEPGGDVGADKDPTKEYRLVQSQITDEVPIQGPVDSATVYVLVCPDQRLYVFRAFHSGRMEEIIKRFPPGSVLHYDGNALAASPPLTQVEALKAFCQSNDIEFIISPTN